MITRQIINLSEAISEPFLARVIYYSPDPDLDLSTLVGQPYDFSLPLPDGSTRPFNGLVARAELGETTVRSTRYTLELRPWFYFLRMGRGCRLFQNQTAPDIIKALAQEAGYTAITDSLSAEYPELEYAVQFNESDFDFLSRLMEEAGIFYYFTHAEGEHKMVLADGPSGYDEGPELSWLGGDFPVHPDTHIWDLGLSRQAGVKSVSVDDYHYLTPSAGLLGSSGEGYPAQAEFGVGHTVQADGENLASLRLGGLENAEYHLTGHSSHPGLAVGRTFSVSQSPRADQNGQWLTTGLSLSCDQEGRVALSLTAIPAALTFRPERRHPRPRVWGPLTGVVCGKSGEKIWTDEYGRIKVRPHWDHKTEADEKSGAWMRVAQPWAGTGRGALFIPRVGDEVLISFLGGDPDRPLVTGSVYNAATSTPWALTDNKETSGFLGQTPDGEGGNELSFSDKKNEERLYFHAQKLLEILVEEERRVTVTGETGDSLTLEKGGRTILIKKGDQSLTLEEGQRTVELKKGGDTLKVKGNRTIEVKGGETRSVKKNVELNIDGNYTLNIKGSLSLKAKSIKLESDQALKAESGTALEIKSGTALEAKAGTGLTLAGTTTFKLSGSAKGTVDGGGMLEVKGGLVKLN